MGGVKVRIQGHPILGAAPAGRRVTITVDGRPVAAVEGEPVAAALMAAGVRAFRRTTKTGEWRGVFCAIGRCTDCVMTIDGVPNVRTCVTPVRDGMAVATQTGLGKWGVDDAGD
jgi:predicted molibdopterin-dependent oxidoreductase YjgC